MKNLIFASMIAAVAASSFIAPVQAASIVIHTDHNKMQMRKHHRHCHTKVVKHMRHHRLVVEKVRVCD